MKIILNKIWMIFALIVVDVTADVRQLPTKEYLPPSSNAKPAQAKIINYDELTPSGNEDLDNKSEGAKDPVPFPGPGLPIPPGYGIPGVVPNFAGGNGLSNFQFPAYPPYFQPGFGGGLPPPYQQSYPGAAGPFPGSFPGPIPGPGAFPSGPVFPNFGVFPNAGNFPGGPELAPLSANGGGGFLMNAGPGQSFPINPPGPNQGFLATTVPGQGFPPGSPQGLPGQGAPLGPGFAGGPLGFAAPQGFNGPQGFPGPGIPPPPGYFPGHFDASDNTIASTQLKTNIAHDTVYGSDGGYVYEKPK